ncbi:MAG: 2-succinyl-5-enolpyruvyl-6-hydroxy-3-cyclohexene-1-carboxylic-acid synthase [Moorea sp. SIO1F2]|nr:MULTISPECIES: 2-succinyl-5-enolpyruvyl-6-hydroxy-3-cyclohexene-1-carboxylic-acid synthase [unclassified Moorena]NEP24600.1 2-succinyl-5-enolpyruvyl-6-hydroxy-3-cyclohexene-1-carboxylic-acid synthase [Moorena sp. SIO3I6]NET83017.1 2-succinyl-5-enolpyruvyl-6-hydroxy-3-cyclohexene-1-carboxylic-acid synthase [Moorena sp. SIO1F2]
MPIDFRNTNSLWASILVETLQRLGLTTAIICPGSRSTPLTVAFAQHPQIEAIPVLDERSASFFALGIARQSGKPVVLVCTSGTAGANFYPAVIEARESRVPLLVLTADRPPELQDCHSGQTIDQIKLYGNYPNWQSTLAVPQADISMLRYLRQTVVHAWERASFGSTPLTHFPTPGPVHLNLPFRDPLPPIPDTTTNPLKSQLQPEEFFAHCQEQAVTDNLQPTTYNLEPATGKILEQWQESQEGIIIAGPAQPQNPKDYCNAIASLSKTLRWPVLAEGLSPVRNYCDLNRDLISTYDLILRNPRLAQQLKPTMVIHIGELPISKELRAWLDKCQPRRWVIDPSHHNLDPLHGTTTHLRMSVEQLGIWVKELKVERLKVDGSPPLKVERLKVDGSPPLKVERLKVVRVRAASPTAKAWPFGQGSPPLKVDGSNLQPDNLQPDNLQPDNLQPTTNTNLQPDNLQPDNLQPDNLQPDNLQPATNTNLQPATQPYLQKWCEAEAKVRAKVDQTMTKMSQLFEGKAAWLLSQCLPPETPLFIANSMPVRDVEFFWKPGNTRIRPWFNRGANGIDGTLSTALGIAHRNQSSVMLTGDLAFLHDTNGFLIKNKFVGHLTIILINNNGGGIFEMLPIAKFDPPFEEFFATPQDVNFYQLCLSYGVEHQLIQSWQQLKQRLKPLPSQGIRVLELPTDRRKDASWRQDYFHYNYY